MAHPAAAGLGAIAKEPGVARARRGPRREDDVLPRPKDRRERRKGRYGAVRIGEMRRRRACRDDHRQLSIAGSGALTVLHIVEGHPGHVALDRGSGQRRLVEGPDVAEGEAMQPW